MYSGAREELEGDWDTLHRPALNQSVSPGQPAIGDMSLPAQISCNKYSCEDIAVLSIKVVFCSEMFCYGFGHSKCATCSVRCEWGFQRLFLVTIVNIDMKDTGKVLHRFGMSHILPLNRDA